jgi:hypothetical protein
MKSKLALILGSTTLAFTSAVLPAAAYEPHEHVFYHEDGISKMSQDAGNGYCRVKFQQLKATGDLGGGFDANRVNHVWAHIQNGDCVANT